MSDSRNRVAAVAERPVDGLEGTPVTVGGESILVGHLSVNQWLAVGELGLEWAARMGPEERQRWEKVSKGEAPSEGLMSLRKLLNEHALIGFYSILLQKDEAWTREHFDLAEFAEVLDAADQANDLRRVWAAFSKVARRWQPPKEQVQRSDSSGGS